MSEGEAKPRADADWRVFQRAVAALFAKIPGCSVAVDCPVQGTRIGTVHVDVLAKFGNPAGRMLPRGHRFVFKVIVECKLWNRPVPQEKIFALKTIVEDVGAALGIIVCEHGMQRGGLEYLDHPVNVIAVTFNELEYMASGLYSVMCSDCGAEAIMPFPPRSGRPSYCVDCYSKRKPRF